MLAAFVGGALTSVQARINGDLSVRLGQPLEAAIWSFGSGLVVLTLVLASFGPVRRGLLGLVPALRQGRIRWLTCLGGGLGGLFVACQTYAVPTVGVAIFTICVVGGQTVNGLVIDGFGIGPAGRTPVTLMRSFASALAVVGVAVAVRGRGGGGQFALVPVILAVLVGAGGALQVASNGRVNRVTAHPMSTTWLNFTTGTVLLLLLAGARSITGSFAPVPLVSAPWWVWGGGLCGIGFIALSAWAVHHLGVLTLGLVMLTGQLACAVALDLVTPQGRAQVSPLLVGGILVTFAGALLAAVSGRTKASREVVPRV